MADLKLFIGYLKSYNDNRETAKQTRALWGVVVAHKYDLDLMKVGQNGLT